MPGRFNAGGEEVKEGTSNYFQVVFILERLQGL